MPILFLITGLIYSIDFLASDAKHQSLAEAFPFSDYKKSWLRTLIVFGATVLTFLIGELFFIMALGFFREWGGIHLWVYGALKQLSVFSFLLQSHALILLALLILIRLTSWSGHLFKSSILSILLIPSLILPYLFNIDKRFEFQAIFDWFPLSFFQPGNIVSGLQNFWHNQTQFTFGREVFLLLAGLLIVEIIIYFTFKMVALKKRKINTGS